MKSKFTIKWLLLQLENSYITIDAESKKDKG